MDGDDLPEHARCFFDDPKVVAASLALTALGFAAGACLVIAAIASLF